jgi:O-antigen/teichoic acid export membrane protein
MVFSLLVAFFSNNILFVYTGSLETAGNTALVLSILIVSKMIHASMIIPYSLQLAYGWVRLSLYINVFSVFLFLPLLFWWVKAYGPAGAAMAWIVVSVIYVAVGVPLMHRKILQGDAGRWIRDSLLLPIAAVVVLLMMITPVVDIAASRWIQGGLLFCLGVAALFVALLATRDARIWFHEQISEWRGN